MKTRSKPYDENKHCRKRWQVPIMVMDDGRGNTPVVVGVPGYPSLVISLHQDKSRGRFPSFPYRRQTHGVRLDHLERNFTIRLQTLLVED